MSLFEEQYPSLESYWRAIILFGRNVASYKFALGQALIDLVDKRQTVIRLEDLAEPFSGHIVRHLRQAKRQGTFSQSRFLEACNQFSEGTIDKDDLLKATVRQGFTYVIDAFHVVNQGEIPVRFFLDQRKGQEGGGIALTDEFYRLMESYQSVNLPHETEARWRLVETAWQLQLTRSVLSVGYDEAGQLLYTEESDRRRINVTSCREALNGYQKGKCFYCFSDISLESDASDSVEVDHFFPWALHQLGVAEPINGVWNLVLACRRCNRGNRGKMARVPKVPYLERLYRRNEFLISSHHPLRETIMAQTGLQEQERVAFLRTAHGDAVSTLVHQWAPSEELPPCF